MKNKTTNTAPLIIIGGLVAMTGISGAVLRSTIVNADNDSVIDPVSITVPVSCTMSGNIDTAHNATLNNGTYSGASGSEYENGIGKTTLTTFCNDQNGFSIYAVGYTGNTIGNTDLVGTSVSGNATIPTGTNTSGSTSNWAMKVNKVTDSSTSYNPANMTITNSFDNYKAVPDEYTKVAEYHAGTGSSATDTILGAKVTTTYAAFISSNQIADTYSGQVKYVMVHPYDHATPQETLIMQNISQWGESIQLGQEVTVIDSRDSKTYTAARLGDGNIWMTQNLDFDIVDGGTAINSTNTDVPYNWRDGGSLSNTHATSDTTWIDSDLDPQSYDPGDLCWDEVFDTSYYGTLTDNTTACTDSNMHYHIGNYYNWTAAVAMADSESYGYDSDEDVDQSICPAGWMLPKSGPDTNSGSFAYLVDEASLTSGASGNIHLTPNYFVYGGEWYGGSSYVGGDGLYWSSVLSDVNYAYDFAFAADSSSSVFPDSHDLRGLGISVRCVARPVSHMTINGLEYMQDFATLTKSDKTAVLNSMDTGTQYQLDDSRDNKTYYISKLADGNVWMTQNLDFDIVDGGNSLDSTNTDVPSNWADAGNLTNTYATNDTTWEYYVDQPESYDPGDFCWDDVIDASYSGDLANNTTTCTSSNIHYHIGNYYNWTAAVAMSDSSAYGQYNDQTDEFENLQSNQSICPAGWTLPKGGSNTSSGSFAYLISQASLTAGTSGNIHSSPTYFVYGGGWDGGSNSVGAGGIYWSSVLLDGGDAYELYFDGYGHLYPDDDVGRTYGHSVRCVAR